MTRSNTETQIDDIQRQLNETEEALEKTLQTLTRASRDLEEQRARRDALRQQLQEVRQAPVDEAETQARHPEAAEPTPSKPLALTSKQRLAQLKHSELVRSSKLFDADWYLATYPDVKSAKKYSQAPHEHYLMYGGFEGRNPGPAFHSAFYLAQYPDVAASKTNPLVHYLLHGHKEGRRIVPEQKKA